MLFSQVVRGIALIVALQLSACSEAPPESAPPKPEPANTALQWYDYVAAFKQRYYQFNPNVAIRNGLHQFDGQLPNLSPSGIARYVAWLESSKQQLGQYRSLGEEDELHKQQR